MTEPRKTDSLSRLQSIDLLCIEFEDAWLCGNRPELSRFILKIEPTERDSLTKELLWIEWHARRCRNEDFQLAEYSTQDELDQKLVEEAWESDQSRIATTAPGLAILGDRYSIVKTHARGGLGQVYEAKDNEVGRRVAIKEVRSEYFQDSESQERLLREARITGRLEHPGIIPVFSIGANDLGNPFYSMRFVEGHSLLEAIKQFFRPTTGPETDDHDKPPSTSGPFVWETSSSTDSEPDKQPGAVTKLNAKAFRGLKFKQLLGRFVYACRAIQYAHSRGVLHRDLKPSNIMLGQHGETLVVDWGLAKDMLVNGAESISPVLVQSNSEEDTFQTNQGTVFGTPGYVSPEQASGQLDALTPASDVFSLGASLFHLLTGHRPEQDSPTSLRSLQPGIPQPLVAICNDAMALDPAERYDSAGSLADDLERWLADEPVSAYRESIFKRSQRWSRNNRSLANTLIGAACLILIAATIITFLNANLNAKLAIAKYKSDATLANTEAELLAAKNGKELEKKAAQAEKDKSRSIGTLLAKILGISEESPNGPILVANYAYQAVADWIANVDTDPEARIIIAVKVMETLNASNLSEKVAKFGKQVKESSGFEKLPIENRSEFYRFWLVNLVKDNQLETATEGSEEVWALLDNSSRYPDSVIRTLVESQLAYSRACIISVRPKQALENIHRIMDFLERQQPRDATALWTTARIRATQAYLALNQPKRALQEIKFIDPSDQNHTPSAQLAIAKGYSDLGAHKESHKILNLVSEGLPSKKISIRLLGIRFDLYFYTGERTQAQTIGKQRLDLTEKEFGKNSEAYLMAQRDLELLNLQEIPTDPTALRPLEEIFQRLKEVIGANDPFTLQTQEELGILKVVKLHNPEGLQLLISAREKSAKHFGKFSLRWIDSSQKLAIGLRNLNRHKEAIPIYYEILETVKGNWEEASSKLKDCRLNLATALVANAEYSKAITFMQSDCESFLDHQEDWGNNTWIAVNNYLHTLQNAGNLEDQAAFIAQIKSTPQKKLGWLHRTTLDYNQILAMHYESTNRINEAQEIYQGLIKNLSKAIGSDHLITLNVKYNYAICQVKSGAKPISFVIDALDEITDRYAGHPYVNIYRISLAGNLFNLNEFEHAWGLYRSLADQALLEQNAEEYAKQLCQLGLCEYRLNDFENAISNLQNSLRIRIEKMDGDWLIAYTQNCLGRALSAADRNEEAAQLLDASFAELEQHQFPTSFNQQYMIKECVDATIAFYQKIADQKRVVDYKNRECQLLDQFQGSQP